VSGRGCNPTGPWLLAFSKSIQAGAVGHPRGSSPRWRPAPPHPSQVERIRARGPRRGGPSPQGTGPALGVPLAPAGPLASSQGAGPLGRRWPWISEALDPRSWGRWAPCPRRGRAARTELSKSHTINLIYLPRHCNPLPRHLQRRYKRGVTLTC